MEEGWGVKLSDPEMLLGRWGGSNGVEGGRSFKL